MDGRRSLLCACSLLMFTGCITTANSQKVQQAAATPHTASAGPTTVSDSKSRKDPKAAARLLVATAKYNESEANSLTHDPEQQYKVRYMAMEHYQQAMKLDAGSVEAHRGLGRIYVDLADFDRAVDIFKKAQAKFPNQSVFWYELGQMHNRRKDFTQAAQCLNKALEMEPENRQYLTILGLTLARAGQTEQSVALLSRSMGAASAHYNVGRMLLHLQRTEEGTRHLQQALQANPNLEPARQLLQEVSDGGRVQVQIDFQAGIQ